MNPRNPVTGSTYLVLGILSLVVCPFLGPVAWSMSNNALSVLDRYERSSGDVSQRGLVEAGRICGMIGTGFLALGLCLVLMRSCAATSVQSGASEDPGTTVTIDGRPASPEERKQIEAAMKNAPPAGSPHSAPK